jgi:hypothetical protein
MHRTDGISMTSPGTVDPPFGTGCCSKSRAGRQAAKRCRAEDGRSSLESIGKHPVSHPRSSKRPTGGTRPFPSDSPSFVPLDAACWLVCRGSSDIKIFARRRGPLSERGRWAIRPEHKQSMMGQGTALARPVREYGRHNESTPSRNQIRNCRIAKETRARIRPLSP